MIHSSIVSTTLPDIPGTQEPARTRAGGRKATRLRGVQRNFVAAAPIARGSTRALRAHVEPKVAEIK